MPLRWKSLALRRGQGPEDAQCDHCRLGLIQTALVHQPSCHLCKLLQQRAKVKCSTCVASINRISRSPVEFLLKSLVTGSVFLTPPMPSSQRVLALPDY